MLFSIDLPWVLVDAVDELLRDNANLETAGAWRGGATTASNRTFAKPRHWGAVYRGPRPQDGLRWRYVDRVRFYFAKFRCIKLAPARDSVVVRITLTV